EKRAWVARVLGVRMPVPGGPRAEGPMLPMWLDAKDRVDGAIGKLQSALRGFKDPDLDRIAEMGLNGVTGRASVGLMVALREADAPGAGEGQRRKLATAVAAYRAFLSDSPVVGLIDANPFGVGVGLRTTLGGALDAIERRLAA
ncbi:MAG: hypothetical protein KGI51_11645, partial [Rhodospirillales bacterium]|nr:hypothetical protein [Rhodospirillales bacterium]